MLCTTSPPSLIHNQKIVTDGVQRKKKFGGVDEDAVFVDETSLQRTKRKKVSFSSETDARDGSVDDGGWEETSLPPELVLTQFGENRPVDASGSK
jgi:hypothetical protein